MVWLLRFPKVRKEARAGGPDHRSRSRFHFLAEAMWRAETVGPSERTPWFPAQGTSWCVTPTTAVRDTEGLEEESISWQNNECEYREMELKIPVSRHGGDVGERRPRGRRLRSVQPQHPAWIRPRLRRGKISRLKIQRQDVWVKSTAGPHKGLAQKRQGVPGTAECRANKAEVPGAKERVMGGASLETRGASPMWKAGLGRRREERPAFF